MYPIIQLNESLSKLLNGESSFPMVLVAGDFNLPDIVWMDGCDFAKPNPTYGCELNNLFLDIINDLLSQEYLTMMLFCLASILKVLLVTIQIIILICIRKLT